MRTFFLSAVLFLISTLLFGQEPPAFTPPVLPPGLAPVPQATFLSPRHSKTSTDSLISVCTAAVSPDSIHSYMLDLEGFGTRFLLASNRRAVASWIRDKFISFGYQNARLDSFQCVVEWPSGSGVLDTSWQYNILATLEGVINQNIDCMTGGHYDAIIYSGGDPYITAPGADDNASSVAAALEIARVLKQQGVAPDVNLTFSAWAAEERGLFGSMYHVIKSLNLGSHIRCYINMDMISNEPGSGPWIFNVNQYEGFEWMGNLASGIATQFTSLTPDPNVNNSAGSDSYPFWLGNFPCVYFSEDVFSPNYHKPTDVVANCNIPYCAEIAKVTLGSLLKMQELPSMVPFTLVNPGTGTSLIPTWKPSPDNNIQSYVIHLGYGSGNYHQSFLTTDTSRILQNLSHDTLYYIGVSAINTGGIEGPITEQTDRPTLVTLAEGILIVDDSEGGILNPTDEEVDAFYRSVLADFSVSEYDAYIEQKIDLSEMGRYSSIIWHVNRQTSVTVLNRSLKDISNYLNLGGNILFTLYQPERAIYKLSTYPIAWGNGSFMHDYLGISYTDLSTTSRFNKAISDVSMLPDLSTDSSKTQSSINHHLTYIEALYPNALSESLYIYGSDFDTATAQGGMHGKPVAVAFQNGIWNTVTLSFPLYYMDSVQSRTFVRKIMTDRFGESMIGISPGVEPGNSVRLLPNPASSEVRLSFTLPRGAITEISMFDILGTKVEARSTGFLNPGTHEVTFDLKGHPAGLYIVSIRSGEFRSTRKLILSK